MNVTARYMGRINEMSVTSIDNLIRRFKARMRESTAWCSVIERAGYVSVATYSDGDYSHDVYTMNKFSALVKEMEG